MNPERQMDLPLSLATHLNLIGQYSGDRLAKDSVTQLKAYSLFTLQLNHRIQKPKGNLFLSAFNVFDTAYVIIPEYATRGRNVLMGISIQID